MKMKIKSIKEHSKRFSFIQKIILNVGASLLKVYSDNVRFSHAFEVVGCSMELFSLKESLPSQITFPFNNM